MAPFTDIPAYLWQRLPLFLLFGGGYLVYQLMAATRLTDAFISWSLTKSKGSMTALILYIIAAAAMLSSFIPNTITVLTFLPMLKKLDTDLTQQHVPNMTTPLMCAAIYGAAIGGMGSMIGSPANAILFGALDIFEVTNRNEITFTNWFIWSLPLVVMLTLAAWGVAAGLGLTKTQRSTRVDVSCLISNTPTNQRQRFGAKLFWLYMGYWVLEAILRQSIPEFVPFSPAVSLLFTGIFLFLIFIRSAPPSEFATGPLLRPSALLQGVPRRGLLFILILGGLFGAVHALGWDEKLVIIVGSLLHGDMPPILLFFLTVVSVIFLTEVLSNTAVVAAFFTIAYYAAQGHDISPLPIMIAVGVASTCAFMTPIATPTNALAFGEMRGASLKQMLLLGLVLNVMGAVILTAWLSWILPLVY